MTKSTSPLHEATCYSSVLWHESSAFPGVRYATREMSLAQRIDLTRRVRELINRNEFLQAGNTAEQVEGALGELLARRLYIEWALVEIEGLTIDGNPATPELLIEKGPENLSDEIAGVIIASQTLSEDERKNF